ncbi:MAG TPA: polyribonucleotide nucleotidyltransferase [Candidatus Binatia bacterium]|nr:polyribonucleotide nucleotidyltransferase [Candidatus Binatia bacterium]
MQPKVVTAQVAGRPISIEVGKLAKQAGGSALVRAGDSVVLVTATAAPTAREQVDFLPLTVDYQEKTFAAGKIPGGFFKREGKPSEKEVLTSRLIDRPVRPLIPKGWHYETQIVATVLSAEKDNDPDMLALCGASAALMVSDVPFAGPIAGIRIGRVDGKFVPNPTAEQIETSDINLIVAGSRDAIVMVEGGARMVADDVMLEALFAAHAALQPILDAQEELQKAVGRPKRAVPPVEENAALASRVRTVAVPLLRAALETPAKHERAAKFDEAKAKTVETLAAEFPGLEKDIASEFSHLKYEAVRQMIVRDKKRLDGRGLADVRPISCDVGLLPRVHGSAVFTRGETQALVATTLGTSGDQQRIDALLGESFKRFMLHYNFPPYSVGEVKFLRGPGRREIGHGALAERAITPVLPSEEEFPYTIRIVSEVLESNGSSSMATVCGSTLSLLDAGVKVKSPVAGIAMGLIKDGEHIAVLSDILGDEDHLGDMDFKVAGTSEGVTALQMDIKIGGVTREVMHAALEQARAGRLHILGEMAKALPGPRQEMSPYAPRITTIKIRTDKIRDVIGPGGKVIRALVEETGCTIDIEDDGTVQIASSDGAAMQKAIDRILGITAEAEVGKIYEGKVRKIVDFGAFVEIMPGTDGLLHISQISRERIKSVSDVLKEGDQVRVKVLEVDRSGKIRLSRREAMAEEGVSE